jgi:hypothetical protein
MKIDIKPVEKSQGLMFKKTLHGVELSVIFSEEEQAIIRERKLEMVNLMMRDIPADVDADKVQKRGLAKKVAIIATMGADRLAYHLTFNKLLKGPDTYFFATPIEAKDYILELKEDVLPLAKAYLEGNKDTASSDSFEL